jgi:hypothetical protein
MLDGEAGNGLSDRVRMVAPIPAARLVAEILPWTLASRGKVLVSYVVSQAANVEVSVRHRGREIVRAAQAAVPGKNVLPLGRRLPDGQNVITLTATAGSARATDRMAMLPNLFLPRRAATAVIPTGEDDTQPPVGTPARGWLSVALRSGTRGLWQPKGCAGRGGSSGSTRSHSQSGMRQPSSLTTSPIIDLPRSQSAASGEIRRGLHNSNRHRL